MENLRTISIVKKNSDIDVKDRITKIARASFSKFGYSKVNTDDLAGISGISKRTLYECFKSKEDILNEVIRHVFSNMENRINEMMKRLQKSKSSNFVEELGKLCELDYSSSATFTKEFIDDLKKNVPHSYQRILDFRQYQMKTYFDKFYSIGVKKGFIKKGINRELFYLVHEILAEHIFDSDVVSSLPISMNDAIREVFKLILTGALTSKGQEEFGKIEREVFEMKVRQVLTFK